jgi:phage tail sheath protein FI
MTSIIESTLPGVIAVINAGTVARSIAQQPTSTFFAVGFSPWGPVGAPTIVTSWLDYVRQFGGFDPNSFLDDALYPFFNLFRGKQAVVCRVVGNDATVATVSLKDGSADAGLNTLRVDAKYPSKRVEILLTVEAGTTADTFKLIVRSRMLDRSEVWGRKEIWDNLTMDANKLAIINQNSLLINVSDLASVTAAPTNNPKPKAEAALADGDDKFSSLEATDFIGTAGPPATGLQAFNDENLGTGQVAVPGITDEATHAALIAHAEDYHRLALLDPAFGASKADVATSRALYGSWSAAIYWPWVKEPAFDGTSLLKFYPPSGFAAGACAQVDRTVGVHKAPANIEIPGAVDVERDNGQSQVDDNTREYLNSKDVNVIVPLASQGVRIYGARVITADRRVSFVHEIRILNDLYYSGKIGYQWAVFQAVDAQGRLFRDLRSTGAALLRRFYQAGALFGKTEKDAFSVVADASNNPPEDLEQGRVHVQWAVRISPTAEQIILNIDNVPLTQDLSVLQ